MRLQIHIQRLALDGIDIPPAQQGALQEAMQAELSHMLAAGGLAPGLLAGRALAEVPAGTVQLTGESDPAHLGQQIAQAVYGGIGR